MRIRSESSAMDAAILSLGTIGWLTGEAYQRSCMTVPDPSIEQLLERAIDEVCRLSVVDHLEQAQLAAQIDLAWRFLRVAFERRRNRERLRNRVVKAIQRANESAERLHSHAVELVNAGNSESDSDRDGYHESELECVRDEDEDEDDDDDEDDDEDDDPTSFAHQQLFDPARAAPTAPTGALELARTLVGGLLRRHESNLLWGSTMGPNAQHAFVCPTCACEDMEIAVTVSGFALTCPDGGCGGWRPSAPVGPDCRSCRTGYLVRRVNARLRKVFLGCSNFSRGCRFNSSECDFVGSILEKATRQLAIKDARVSGVASGLASLT